MYRAAMLANALCVAVSMMGFALDNAPRWVQLRPWFAQSASIGTMAATTGNDASVATSHIDSKAVFTARAKEPGIDGDTLASLGPLGARGYGTYANMAFCAAFANPGAEEVQYFVDNVVVSVLGQADHRLTPTLKRLWHESQLAYTAEQKRRFENSD
eukprot:1907046-Amphidinium_carterae.1